MADPRRELKRYIEQRKAEKAREEAERQARNDADRNAVLQNVGQDLANALAPVLPELAKSAQISEQTIKNALKEALSESIQINMPEVKIPEFKIPAPVVNIPPFERPVVNVPAPTVNVPETVFPERFSVDVANERPLQMIPVDVKGKPIQFGAAVGGGGKSDFFTIKDIRASSASIIDQIDGALKVTGSLSATLSADYGSGEIGDNTLRIVQATDAISSVNIVSGSSSGTEYTDGDTDDTPSGAVAMGDTGEESGNIFALAIGEGATGSNSLRVTHATDAVLSTVVNSGTITAVTDITNSVATYSLDGDGNYRSTLPVEASQLDIDDLDWNTDSVQVHQVSGANWSVEVSNFADSTASYLIDGDGNYRGTLPVEASQLDIDDLDWNTDSVQVHQVSGANWSVEVTGTPQIQGTVAHDSAVGDNPVQVAGEARTTNRTAVGDGDVSRVVTDDLGRQLVRPIQVRDLTKTAYATISSDAETTLISGVASAFLDLVYVMGANQSDGAVTLDFYTGSGGTVLMSLEIPANSTAGVAPAMPVPMTEAAQAWYVDFADSDTTGTTVDITGLFSQEV